MSPSVPSIADLVAAGRSAAGIGYALAQAALVVYTSHRLLVLWRCRRGARAAAPAPVSPAAWPVVTVQLPVYNERRVVERLIDAVGTLDYPRERLEIQVLDDSTDETCALAAAAVARQRARGVDIVHLRRGTRRGYKAGALAEGLARARGTLLAVFDADFVPRPDFLRRLVPHFADPRVGMAQARWSHLNRGRSLLTGAQAAMLDSHFLLEHRSRAGHGLFFNFNGTAGVWRRACIESAGGWTHDTLTEDLDLSYRAQLAGWRFVFDPSVDAPAELPGDMEALKSQQRRWTKGAIQTARKVLPRLLASRLPLAVKLEAFLHLTGNVAYPLLLALALLLLPVMLDPRALPPWLAALVQLAVLALGVAPVLAFLLAGQRAAGVGWRRALPDGLAALVLGAGLSANNARAAVAGLGPRTGDWERTPKTGDGARRAARPAYRSGRGPAGFSELALALYAVALALAAALTGSWRALPFAALLLAGFLAVGLGSLRASLAPARGPRGS